MPALTEGSGPLLSPHTWFIDTQGLSRHITQDLQIFAAAKRFDVFTLHDLPASCQDIFACSPGELSCKVFIISYAPHARSVQIELQSTGEWEEAYMQGLAER